MIIEILIISKHLKKKIYKLKLKNYYKIIGIVPFEDLCSLIYNSLGVINPSVSEVFLILPIRQIFLEKLQFYQISR